MAVCAPKTPRAVRLAFGGAAAQRRLARRLLAFAGLASAASAHADPLETLTQLNAEYSNFFVIGTIAFVAVLLVIMVIRLARKNAKPPASGKKPADDMRRRSRPPSRSNPSNSRSAARNTEDTFSNQNRSAAEKKELPPISLTTVPWNDAKKDASGFKSLLKPLGEPEPEGLQKFGFNPFFTQNESGIEVQEISNTLSEAELVRSLGLHQQAIDLLERLIGESINPKPKIWLMLFDLYVKTNQKEKYDHLAQGFRTCFNAAAPEWDLHSDEVIKQIDDYPAPVERLTSLWGTPGCVPYLESLLYDNRNATRQGFSLAAYNDIIFLIDIIEMLDEARGLKSLTTSGIGAAIIRTV